MASHNEMLSQNEVDALLKSVGDEAAPLEETVESPDGIRPCDLTNPPRTLRGRMPTLDIIHDRFSRMLRSSIAELLRRTPEIGIQSPRVEKYGDFLSNLISPANLNIVNLKSLTGIGLIVIEPALVFTTVDHLFGGDGRYQMGFEGRDFTPVEQRIIERLVRIISADYEQAWAPVHPLGFEFVRSETHSQFANILSPTELVIGCTFQLECGNVKSAIHFCFPYASLEPLRDALTHTRPTGDAGPGERWTRMLHSQVQMAQVQLSAPLTQVRTQLGDLMKLKIGDVIAIDVPQKLFAEVENIPLLECRYGVSNGRYALKVERIVPPSTPNLNLNP